VNTSCSVGDALVACYPITRPASGDDPRFSLGLALDAGRVLAAHGYPPITTAADLIRLQQALFNLIYQQKQSAR
jgi:hypothetical protein